MKVLITGISSPVAQTRRAQLVAEGHEVIGVDRRPWEGDPRRAWRCTPSTSASAPRRTSSASQARGVIHMATVTHLVAAPRSATASTSAAPARSSSTRGSTA
jgi:UDP-glucose 4-epimerase